MADGDVSPQPLTKKERQRLHGLLKQHKRQIRAQKKRAQRRNQRQHIQQALRFIGATWEKNGKQFSYRDTTYYLVTWRGERYSFERPGHILRWAREQATRKIDYAELEIEHLIEQARQEAYQEE